MFRKRKPVEVIFHEDFKTMDIPVLGLVLKWTDCAAGVREVEESKLVNRKGKPEVITTKEPKNVWIYQTDNLNLMRFLIRYPQKKTGIVNPREVIEKGWLQAVEVKGLVDQTDTPIFDEPRPKFEWFGKQECIDFAVYQEIPFDPKAHVEDLRVYLARWWDRKDENEQPAGAVDSSGVQNGDSEFAHPPGESTGSVGFFESEDHNGTN